MESRTLSNAQFGDDSQLPAYCVGRLALDTANGEYGRDEW